MLTLEDIPCKRPSPISRYECFLELAQVRVDVFFRPDGVSCKILDGPGFRLPPKTRVTALSRAPIRAVQCRSHSNARLRLLQHRNRWQPGPRASSLTSMTTSLYPTYLPATSLPIRRRGALQYIDAQLLAHGFIYGSVPSLGLGGKTR
jgi:hypothetical protein